MSKYNATIIQHLPGGGTGTSLARVETLNGKPQMLRSNMVQCTGFEDKLLTEDIPDLGGREGDAAYDVYIRATHKDSRFKILLDGGEGYKEALTGLMLPPTYK